ncbi:MAG: hypothetical protein AAF078_05820 [Planctomycetota bacterium]
MRLHGDDLGLQGVDVGVGCPEEASASPAIVQDLPPATGVRS